MFSKVFLAMTAREMANPLPERVAYMACHFSPYSKGLSNAPQHLPKNSLLLVDDSMPVPDHDPELVTSQLRELVEKFSPHAVLLDFQRERSDPAAEMAHTILQALPCSVAVTASYARELGCPVFLSPSPVNMALEDYLADWLKQGVYLEVAPEMRKLTVTESGCEDTALPTNTDSTLPLTDERLHCHYGIEVFPDRAVFTLQRTKEDLAALVEEAYTLGVQGAVGLYQELNRLLHIGHPNDRISTRL